MFSLGSSNSYYLYDQPADMRKGFDGLCGLVISQMKSNPMNGSVYVFLNKNRNLIKLLHWEHGGFVLYYKRLEKGVFERPAQGLSSQISWRDLMLIIEGIRLNSVRQKIRYKSA